MTAMNAVTARSDLSSLRASIREALHLSEASVLAELTRRADLTPEVRTRGTAHAVKLVEAIRNDARPGMMEVFLAEYGLSTREGIALMCLAEALLRVPDAETIDALIEDKIAPSSWSTHLGKSTSPLVNASTWALMLTGKVLQEGEGIAQTLRGAIKRLGEPVIRTAVGRAMKEMGAQFVLGETIEDALKRGASARSKGYTFSYDMLGEAALTQADADGFFDSYAKAIAALAPHARDTDIRRNPGISVKLSALHPRYEEAQRADVLKTLTKRTLTLAQAARDAGMGFNIDAEEADRLDLSLDVIQAVLGDPSLAGWDGFGVVVQAYGVRALPVLDWLHALAQSLDRRIMVRLVKGAYWDTEIKHAQVEGLAGYPVFTRKAATDVSYLSCAAALLRMTDRIYPQFATHNAQTLGTILEMGGDPTRFEVQRLHGMGVALHDTILQTSKVRSRIYAPVGAHRDLLAYLVRRLLENGANSSFVNQIVDLKVPAATVATDPFEALGRARTQIPMPKDLYGAGRRNSSGWDLNDPTTLARIDAARAPYRDARWNGALADTDARTTQTVTNPADPRDIVGKLAFATHADMAEASATAQPWDAPAPARAAVLCRAADLLEAHYGEIFALLAREAGKTLPDAVAELREAVDFLRFYANEALALDSPARGIFACISPWNFPLAIFLGQISAALAAGNAVLAKPAEQTSLTATLAVALLHEAGVPDTALHLLPGRGDVVGAALTSDPRVSGVCFTGSTATGQRINRSMADNLSPIAPLIAETGGLNAMIVDSTALPEQAVRDIVASAFQSAGQRCSALRMLYLQEDIAKPFLRMLTGAMDCLCLGQPWDRSTDVGPVIDRAAQAKINAHIAGAQAEGRVLKQLATPAEGTFVAPTLIRVNGISDMAEEVFGPVLHVATFAAEDLDAVIEDINATGYGLTFGLHTRIDARIEEVTRRVRAGNVYVNRNQIGAVVGTQPFGGEGLSGTGPKAGGPRYVPRFAQPPRLAAVVQNATRPLTDLAILQARLTPLPARSKALETTTLPGPTGESNRLSIYGRGTVLCLGPGEDAALEQAKTVSQYGCVGVPVPEGVAPSLLAQMSGFDAVVCAGEDADLRPLRQALAARPGAIVPLWAEADLAARCILERHVCVDTTAAGGNASLLAQSA